MAYALPLGDHFKHIHITQLEMLNTVMALKVWAELWQDEKVEINCDNLVLAKFLNSGKTRDSFLALCARNIWLLTAMFNIHPVISHIPGKSNHIADLQSCWTMTNNPEEKLKQLLPQFLWINTLILQHLIMIFNIFQIYLVLWSSSPEGVLVHV